MAAEQIIRAKGLRKRFGRRTRSTASTWR